MPHPYSTIGYLENMSQEYPHEVLYPTVDEVVTIHADIVDGDDDATAGVRDEGQIEFILDFISEGHFGEVPETIHEKAGELMRLLAANHPFVDGNKRTALNTTWTFYAMNGLYFDYGEEIKAILKLFAVKEEMVDFPEVVNYFEDISYGTSDDRVSTFFIQAVHLPRWYQNLNHRLRDFIEGDIREVIPDDGDITDIDESELENLEITATTDDLLELTLEHKSFVEEITVFRDENEEELSDEVLEFVEKVISDWDDIKSTLTRIVEDNDPELQRELSQRLIEENLVDGDDIRQ